MAIDKRKGLVRKITGEDGAEMVLVPAGEFWMGSPDGEGGADEYPRHKVWLDAFCMDAHTVTVAQYRKYCGETGKAMPDVPPWGWQDDHPIGKVTWKEMNAYAQYYGKRLPTEAEWEYACRAGSETKYCYGDDEERLGEYAWYGENPDTGSTHPVGRKKPNAWGLYDMHGNVWERCNDWYREEYYQNSPYRNPRGPKRGQYRGPIGENDKLRVLRGGSWSRPADDCRSSCRGGNEPSFGSSRNGFRCVRSAGSN